MAPNVRIRKDILDLTDKETDKLIYAWIGIQTNEPDPDTKLGNPNSTSFFNIAGFHGEPFRGAGYGNPGWWGGYCNHGNVLFPTWHRAHLLCLENALRSIENCGDATLPFWNQVILPDVDNPIPDIFLQKQYTWKTTWNGNVPGDKVDNPLYSYKLQRAIIDRLSPIPDADYSKPIRYETVRYPFSGLVGKTDVATTTAHNDLINMLGEEKINQLLQENVSNWLFGDVINHQGETVGGYTCDKYIRSLSAPNYTVYSNTTSAQRWNDDRFEGSEVGSQVNTGGDSAVVSIESPHNAIHLAVGGFEIPGIANYDHYPGANGDMGENDTACFDPIFFFHHCFIDLMFWAWQVKNGSEDRLDIFPGYPGTNSVDNQGSTPGIPGNTWLDVNTPLNPFKYTSYEVTNIADLNYSYNGYEQVLIKKIPKGTHKPAKHLQIGGISRADAKGSFFVSAWGSQPNAKEQTLIGVEPVLSRWHVTGCANCGTHLNFSAVIPLPDWDNLEQSNFQVRVHTRDNRLGNPSPGGRTPSLRLGNVLAGSH